MVFLPRNDKKLSKKRDKPTSTTTATTTTTSSNKNDYSNVPPFRDCANLFCQTFTLDCALKHHCIPCGYKIALFDVALDKEFTKAVPNQRPEQCKRLSTPTTATDGTMGYRSGQSVLTVGDGDFSFSLAVARIVHTKNATGVIATSYESQETLQKCYSTTLNEMLEECTLRNVVVGYQVDATSLTPNTLIHVGKNKKAIQLPKLLDRIVWNFPCTAIANGQDGQNDAMEQNKQLVRNFCQRAQHLLAPNGEVHLCHKTKPPFDQWRLEDVVTSSCGLLYHGRVVLDRATLPPYVPRKALDKKSFPCHDACVYVFGMSPPDATSTIPPPAEKDATNLSVGVHKQMIVPVDHSAILKVRNALLAHVSAGKKRSHKGSSNSNKKQKKF